MTGAANRGSDGRYLPQSHDPAAVRSRIRQAEYRRSRSFTPKEVAARATLSGDISLRKAGLRPGTRYLATPQPGGAILLRPLP